MAQIEREGMKLYDKLAVVKSEESTRLQNAMEDLLRLGSLYVSMRTLGPNLDLYGVHLSCLCCE